MTDQIKIYFHVTQSGRKFRAFDYDGETYVAIPDERCSVKTGSLGTYRGGTVICYRMENTSHGYLPGKIITMGAGVKNTIADAIKKVTRQGRK